VTADNAFREHIAEMIDGWYLPDPTSAAYSRVLDRLTNPVNQDDSIPGITQQCEPERLVEICIEIRSVTPTLWDATSAMIGGGEIVKLLDMLDAVPPDNPLPGVIRARIATPEHFAKLLEAASVDTKRLEDFARRVGNLATPVLLDSLAAAPSRATRRKLLDALAKLGDGIGPEVVARLRLSTPWYTQRNLLLLLGALSKWPSDFSPLPFANHQDVRVRREALRLMLKRPATRMGAIATAIGDVDLQIVRLGLDAMQKDCPPAAVRQLVQKLWARTLPTEFVVLGVRALTGANSVDVLLCLLNLATVKTRWLRRERLAPKSDVMLAALAVLAKRWSTDARAAKLVARAGRSGDSEIRTAVASHGPAT
jgi:hypothetical protein